MGFDRISVDHRVMAGVPCIRGTRIPVATVVGMVADDMSVDEIVTDFPQLAIDDIQEALLALRGGCRCERTLPLQPSV